jgi:exonuclease SbcC
LFGEVVAADENLSSARDARAQIENEFNSLRNAENAYSSLIAKLESVTAQYREQNAQNTDLIELSAMFNRDKENGQNLNIYVLAAIFKNVLAAANRHFEGLLGGQFRLELDSEANSDGRALRGLGVRVFDSHTGSYAPAKTLSGGETFCASLSLALGLADFVRQGAGGIEIGTLFIDEGFGSLSDGPLTDVMNMLTSLQRGGRTVGLISHVDEMKSQITEKIEVTKASKDSPATLTVSWHQPS